MDVSKLRRILALSNLLKTTKLINLADVVAGLVAKEATECIFQFIEEAQSLDEFFISDEHLFQP